MKTTQRTSRRSRYVLSVKSFLLSSFTPHFIGSSQILEEPSSIWKARHWLLSTSCKSLSHLKKTRRSESQATYRAQLYESHRGHQHSPFLPPSNQHPFLLSQHRHSSQLLLQERPPSSPSSVVRAQMRFTLTSSRTSMKFIHLCCVVPANSHRGHPYSPR